MSDDIEAKIEAAIKNPKNLGEMKDADAVGTVGSAIAATCCGCGSNSRKRTARK